jgi:hypothetical protein
MARILTIALFLHLLAFGAWFFFFRGSERFVDPVIGVDRALVTETKAEDDFARLTTAEESSDREGDTRRVSVAETEGPPLPSDVVAEESVVETPKFFGRIQLEMGGDLFETPSGQVSLTIWSGRSGRGELVDVLDGAFEFSDFHDGKVDRVSVDSAELDGIVALPVSDAVRQADGSWFVTVREATAPRLRVIDSESGSDVPDVVLYAIDDVSVFVDSGDPMHPGLEALRRPPTFGPANSPLDLQPSSRQLLRGSLPMIVGAPGWAWKMIELPFGGEPGREVVTELEPGGALQLRTIGVPSDGELFLRVLNEWTQVYEQALTEDVMVRLDGLPVGDLSVAVQRGELWWEAAEFARENTSIARDTVTEVTVQVGPEAGVRDPVHQVELVFEVGVDWEVGDYLQVHLKRTDPGKGEVVDEVEFVRLPSPTTDGADAGLRISEAQQIELPSGSYLAGIEVFGALFEFDVTGDGEFRFRVDPPVPFSVSVVDGVTGLPASDAYVAWCAPDFAKLGGFGWSRLEWNAETERFEALGPRGPIMVGAEMDGRGRDSGDLDLTSAVTHLDLTLGGLSAVELRLLCDGEPIALLEGWLDADVSVLEGQSMPMVLVGEGSVEFRFEEPGRYSVTAPELDGYIAPEPLEIDVVLGEDRVLDIHYTRRP